MGHGKRTYEKISTIAHKRHYDGDIRGQEEKCPQQQLSLEKLVEKWENNQLSMCRCDQKWAEVVGWNGKKYTGLNLT